jgi:hypothetical protein
VTGYDFLEDAAHAVLLELQDGLEQEPIDTLIMDSELSPEDPLAWTGDDLQNACSAARMTSSFCRSFLCLQRPGSRLQDPPDDQGGHGLHH